MMERTNGGVTYIPLVQTLEKLGQYMQFPRHGRQAIENAMLRTPNLLLQIGRKWKVLVLADVQRLSK